MDKTHPRRSQPSRISTLPSTRSVSPSIVKDNVQTLKPTHSRQNSIGRSNSMEFFGTNRVYGNMKPSMNVASTKHKSNEVITSEKECNNANYMQRSGPRNIVKPKRPSRSCPTSPIKTPSAWALSPGRSSPLFLPPESDGRCGFQVKNAAVSNEHVGRDGGGDGGGGGNGGGVVKGVLKYLKQKKVSKVHEEKFHQFRIMHNRLVQWRFVNARAEAVMISLKKIAESKIFCVWVKIMGIRSSVAKKGLQVQKIKHGIKLCDTIFPQIYFLDEWEMLEKKNFEALIRLQRKLSALSVVLPLVQGVEADELSLFKAMSTANGVMGDIEEIATKFQPQAEKILYQLTELLIVSKLEEECIKELEKYTFLLKVLLQREKSLRVHLLQGNLLGH